MDDKVKNGLAEICIVLFILCILEVNVATWYLNKKVNKVAKANAQLVQKAQTLGEIMDVVAKDLSKSSQKEIKQIVEKEEVKPVAKEVKPEIKPEVKKEIKKEKAKKEPKKAKVKKAKVVKEKKADVKQVEPVPAKDKPVVEAKPNDKSAEVKADVTGKEEVKKEEKKALMVRADRR